MDIIKPLIANLTIPLINRRDGYVIRKHTKYLQNSQYLSSDQLADCQLRQLKSLVEFCFAYNSFYRDRFLKLGLRPADIGSLDDLKKFPVLTKDEIRKAAEGMFSRGYGKHNTEHFRTGGSTGLPLHVYVDRSAIAFKMSATRRHNSWAHRIPGDRLACIWGDTDKPQPFRARLRNSLTERAFFLDTLKFDESHIIRFLKQIRKYLPPVLMGHAHSVFRLAQYLEKTGIEDISFQGIITTAMMLSDEERSTIETVFRSPVFNRYGCEELGLIASECEAHRGLHIFAEGLIVEVAAAHGTIPGNMLITDLAGRAMPLLRYEIGDAAIPVSGACPCGRGLPRLHSILGRTADFLYTPDHRPVFGISILDTFIIHIKGVRQAQLIQDRYNHITFRLVRDEDFSNTTLASLHQTVLRIFGPDMQYDVTYVEKIPQTERGKYRFSICKIEQAHSHEDPPCE